MLLSLAAFPAALLHPSAVRAAAVGSRRAPLTASVDDTAPNWFVTVPSSLEAIAEQAAQSTIGAVRAGRQRIWIEVAAPEFDPSSPHYRQLRFTSLVTQIALPLLQLKDALPVGRPQVKMLYASAADAAVAGGSTFATDLPVSVLGSASAIGPRDGAFVLVAPSLSSGLPVERAVADLLAAAGNRPVVVINPRLGNSALTSTFERAYLLRPLSVLYRQDSYAGTEPKQGSGCLLRCYPHEWSVLVQRDAAAGAADWFYAGRFPSQPTPPQLEAMLVDGLTRARYA